MTIKMRSHDCVMSAQFSYNVQVQYNEVFVVCLDSSKIPTVVYYKDWTGPSSLHGRLAGSGGLGGDGTL